jgi:hypothetical protein
MADVLREHPLIAARKHGNRARAKLTEVGET